MVQMPVMKKYLMIVLIPAVSLPTLSALCYFTGVFQTAVSQFIYSATKVFTVVWPLLAWGLWLRKKWQAPKAWMTRRDLGLGLLTGLLIAVATVLADRAFGGNLTHYLPQIQKRVEELGIMEHYIWFALFLAVIHSAIEEVYWRWLVYGCLRDLVSQKPAHGLAALSFAAHHVVVLWVFFGPGLAIALGAGVAFGGVLWSIQYQKTGSLWSSWLSHMLADLAILWIGYQWLITTPR